jgi:hypothetical protein
MLLTLSLSQRLLFLFLHFYVVVLFPRDSFVEKVGGWVVMVERKREKRIDAIKTQARTIRVCCVLVCASRYRLR